LIEDELVSVAGEYDVKRLTKAMQPTEEETMNEAKRRRDLLAKATKPTGKEATDEIPSAAGERDAKRRQELLAKTTKPTRKEATDEMASAAGERDAKRRQEVLAKTKPTEG
jgi:hypothetical protein